MTGLYELSPDLSNESEQLKSVMTKDSRKDLSPDLEVKKDKDKRLNVKNNLSVRTKVREQYDFGLGWPSPNSMIDRQLRETETWMSIPLLLHSILIWNQGTSHAPDFELPLVESTASANKQLAFVWSIYHVTSMRTWTTMIILLTNKQKYHPSSQIYFSQWCSTELIYLQDFIWL